MKSSFRLLENMPFCLQRLSNSALHSLRFLQNNSTSEVHFGIKDLEPTSFLNTLYNVFTWNRRVDFFCPSVTLDGSVAHVWRGFSLEFMVWPNNISKLDQVFGGWHNSGLLAACFPGINIKRSESWFLVPVHSEIIIMKAFVSDF